MPAKKGDNSLKDMKLLYVITYLLLFITGIVVYLVYGERDKRLRFHAVQAILYGICIVVLAIIIRLIVPFVPGLLGVLLHLVIFVLWLLGLYVGYRAMDGDDILIPFVGETAQKYS